MANFSIIIVSYNVKEFLEQSLLSVKKAAQGLSYEIFVVDNASTDGSARLIRDKFPEVTLIANSKNKGFAAANNQALIAAKGKYVILLNPDTVVQEDTFVTVKEFLDANPECGMVGCKILNPDGSLQLACRRSFPTLWVGFTRITGLSKIFPRSRRFGRYNLTYLDPDEICEVEAISGSFMVVRKKVVQQVGPLDDAFFMYGEDLDWCFRIKEAGWKIYYLPATKIIHFKGESSKKSEIDLTLTFYQAMKLFVEKHYQSRYFYVPQWFLITGIIIRAGITFLGKFIKAITPVIFDLVLLNISLMIALLIRFGSLIHLKSYLIVTMIYSFIWLMCIAILGGYGTKKHSFIRAVNGVVIGFILNASITFFFNQYAFSRAVVLISGTLNILFIGGWRFIFRLLPRLGLISPKNSFGKAVLGRRTLVVGSEDGGEKIIEKLRSRVDGGYQVTGLVTLDGNNNYKSPSSAIRKLGSLDSLDDIIQQEKIQEVIFSTEDLSYDKILEIMAKMHRRGINFKLIPSNMEVIIGKATIDRIGALPMIDIDYRLDRPMSILSKRMTDIIISSAMLIIAMPTLFYIKTIRKVRTKKKKILTYQGGVVEVEIFNTVNKSVPGWIRYLPYFKFVFTGELSVVGSEMVEYSEKAKNAKRIALKPGLVGLVQLNKDSAINAEDKQRYDLFYLKNYSPLLDMEIILKSILKI